jgi:ribonuclease Y
MNLTPWLAGGLLGLAIGYFIRVFLALRLKDSVEKKAEKEVEAAKTKAKEIIVEAKAKASSILEEASQEERLRKNELRKLEERLLKREEFLDQKIRELDSAQKELKLKEEELLEKNKEAQEIRERAISELEKIAGLKKEEAKNIIFEEIRQKHKDELTVFLANLEKTRKEEIEAKAKEVIVTAIQRCARNTVANVTTSVVNLPDEDMKAKIIGKEGRNIRTFERLTGVELIIDETPESVVLSSFDPLRRELAKIALEKLIKDGRIHPAKIEEKVEEAKEELEAKIQKIGEEAVYEVGILDFPKEIVYLLGKLYFRTSYGQNVLEHSIEVAYIAAMIAEELGLNVEVAKKGALLHDIGKALDHEVEGSHVEIGRKLLKKYNIGEEVIKAMEPHHDEYPYAIPEAYVVAAADAISAARPGARRETLEKYIKRLEDIERVVNSFDGVKQSYAVSAGREVRVFVSPEKLDDFGAFELAKNIAHRLQSEVEYPGEIKVTVIRETRAIEYAR